MDIWVEPTSENARKVWKALDVFGAPLQGVSVKDFCDRELVYQIGIAPNRIDIMMDIPGVSFAVAWKSSVKTTHDQEPSHVMGLEELIAAKRTSNREQDRLDLRNLVAKKKKGQRCQR